MHTLRLGTNHKTILRLITQLFSISQYGTQFGYPLTKESKQDFLLSLKMVTVVLPKSITIYGITMNLKACVFARRVIVRRPTGMNRFAPAATCTFQYHLSVQDIDEKRSRRLGLIIQLTGNPDIPY